MTSFPHDHPLLRWLQTEARLIGDPTAFLTALAETLRAHGVDVVRMTTGVPTLHPQLFSWSGLWEEGKGASERLYRTEDDPATALENSPIRIAYRGEGPVHCYPQQPPEPDEFGIIADLRRAGLTEYIVYALPFSDGTYKALSVATRRPDGFGDEAVGLLVAAMPAIAANLEVQALRRLSHTLLDTYVGRQAGRRVLDGEIRRGAGETIRAVIWLCDLRGFTTLSETLPGRDVIDLLNGYFGIMCDGIDAHEGEVLKFIGDALLAIFPITGADAGAACRRALDAAVKVESELAALNTKRERSGAPTIDYGIALHVGDVVYGNVGGAARLDFTVIGPAVNLTARIESLCRDLGRRPLLSQAFVETAGIDAKLVGAFDLKGIAAAQTVYVPVDATFRTGMT